MLKLIIRKMSSTENSKNKVRYSVARPQKPGEEGGDSFYQIESRVREARWVLLFVTETTKRDNMIGMFLAELLSIGIDSNLLKVIPILKDVSPAELPSFFRPSSFSYSTLYLVERVPSLFTGFLRSCH
jgi:hypothetical protein